MEHEEEDEIYRPGLAYAYFYHGNDGQIHTEWITMPPAKPSDKPVFTPQELKDLEELRKEFFKAVGIPEILYIPKEKADFERGRLPK